MISCWYNLVSISQLSDRKYEDLRPQYKHMGQTPNKGQVLQLNIKIWSRVWSLYIFVLHNEIIRRQDYSNVLAIQLGAKPIWAIWFDTLLEQESPQKNQ